MKYNEYKASEGKVLLDIDNFTYGITIGSKLTLNLVEVTLQDAKYYYNKYQEELAKQQEAVEPEKPVEEIIEEEPILLKGAKGLRTTAEVEPADPVQRLKNLLKEEMVFKGYNLNNLVEPIIHELK